MNALKLLVLTVLIYSCSISETDRTFLLIENNEIESKDYSVGYNTVKRFTGQTKSVSAIIPYEMDSDTLFYVVNSNDGWQIISNDQRTTPILASGKDDYLDPYSTDHNGIKVWMGMASDYVKAVKESPLDDEQKKNIMFWRAFPEIALRAGSNNHRTKSLRDSSDNGSYHWKMVVNTQLSGIYVTDYVPHLISTKWGQGYPWNEELPNDYCIIDGDSIQLGKCLTGCVAVSISQIMYYWHHTFGYPNRLYHDVSVNGWQQWLQFTQSNVSITTSNLNHYSTRWDDMPQYSSGNHTDYVGDLMLYIGKNVYMYYSSLSSVADINTNIFQDNNMAFSSSLYHYPTISDCLDSSKPVIISAFPYGSNSGHIWIIDGKLSRVYTYQTSRIWYELDDGNIHGIVPEGTYYYTDEEAHAIDPDIYDGKTTYTYNSTSNNYLLMNWGYDGLYDDAEYSSFVNWHPNNVNEPIYSYDAHIYYNFTNIN